jgi:hypothetical protein
LAGAKVVRDRIPTWVAVLCAVGFSATLFSCITNAYPFLDVANPLQFGSKIIVTAILTNVLGYVFYRSRAA